MLNLTRTRRKKNRGEAAKTDILVVNKVMMNKKDLTYKILKCCYAVHSELVPGLLEKIYQKALHIELIQNGFFVDAEVEVPVFY